MSDNLKVALINLAHDQVCLQFTMGYFVYLIIHTVQQFAL